MVCSPTSSARWLPASAEAKSSAAPEVPVSTSSVVGRVIAPSPDRAAIVSRSSPLVSRIASVPLATNSRASATPRSGWPPEVRRTSTINEEAPAFVRSAAWARAWSAVFGPMAAMRR